MSKYWCDRKILVTIDGPHRHSTIRIDKPFARIGSHRSSDIVLDHDDIEKRSLYLHATNSGIYCFGLSNAHADLRGWMDPNEAVSVGPFWISAQLTDPIEMGTSHDDADDIFALTAPSPQLLVRCNGEAAGKFHLKRRLSILGRRAPCKLRLQGQEISAAHCVFFVDNGQTWVIDLLSAAGTVVRGQSCDVERLHGGDRVQLANVELVFRADAANVEAEADSATGSAIEVSVAERDIVNRTSDIDTNSIADRTGVGEKINRVEPSESVGDKSKQQEGIEPASDTLDLGGQPTYAVKEPDSSENIDVLERLAGEAEDKVGEESPSPSADEASHGQTNEAGDENAKLNEGKQRAKPEKGPKLVASTQEDDNAVAQHPNRPLSAEIDKLFASEMINDIATRPVPASPPTKPKGGEPNRPKDDLERVTNRLVAIETHKSRQKLWSRIGQVLIFLVVGAVCIAGLTVAYQMLPADWKLQRSVQPEEF